MRRPVEVADPARREKDQLLMDCLSIAGARGAGKSREESEVVVAVQGLVVHCTRGVPKTRQSYIVGQDQHREDALSDPLLYVTRQ